MLSIQGGRMNSVGPIGITRAACSKTVRPFCSSRTNTSMVTSRSPAATLGPPAPGSYWTCEELAAERAPSLVRRSDVSSTIPASP